MARLIQMSALLLLAFLAINVVLSTPTRRSNIKVTPLTARSIARPATSPKTSSRSIKQKSPITEGAARGMNMPYKTYYLNNDVDCGTTHYLSDYDTVQVNAWQSSGSHVNARSSCKVTFILNTNNYHLEAKYGSYNNYIKSQGVSLNVYGGYSRDLIIYRDWISQSTYSSGQYQRIEVDLENDHSSTNFDFSIIISAQNDNCVNCDDSVSVWWLGVLVPAIFIAIIASSVGCCVRRRRNIGFQRMNNPVTVATATTTYPTGPAAYPNTGPYPQRYQEPPAPVHPPAAGHGAIGITAGHIGKVVNIKV